MAIISGASPNHFRTSMKMTIRLKYILVSPPSNTLKTAELWQYLRYAAYNPCPEGWRVPSYNELKALKGSSTKTTLVSGTHGSTKDIMGVYLDGSDATAPSSGVFLPCGGYRDTNGEASSRGTYASYWSSSLQSGNQDDAYCMGVDDYYAACGRAYRAKGYYVRCVQK